jgi:hypothetical protein
VKIWKEVTKRMMEEKNEQLNTEKKINKMKKERRRAPLGLPSGCVLSSFGHFPLYISCFSVLLCVLSLLFFRAPVLSRPWLCEKRREKRWWYCWATDWLGFAY